jgi:hypothetical protein
MRLTNLAAARSFKAASRLRFPALARAALPCDELVGAKTTETSKKNGKESDLLNFTKREKGTTTFESKD